MTTTTTSVPALCAAILRQSLGDFGPDVVGDVLHTVNALPFTDGDVDGYLHAVVGVVTRVMDIKLAAMHGEVAALRAKADALDALHAFRLMSTSGVIH
jgi:hypothetical protein